MKLIAEDDLLPLDEYDGRREEFYEAHWRYCDLYRRVRLGPSIVMIFENRQTLWFRVQELLRVARIRESAWIRRELDVINSLLPKRHSLQAALVLVEPGDVVNRKSIFLCVGSAKIPGRLTALRPEDKAVGLAHWVEFSFAAPDLKLFANARERAWVELIANKAPLASDALTENMRQSLLDDLELSKLNAA